MSTSKQAQRKAPQRGTSGYGGRSLERAASCAWALRFGWGELGVVAQLAHLVRLPVLIWYLVRLPRADVPLSDRPAGRMIGEHLSCRRWGLPRFRLAQGVLCLPPDFSSYVRGRRRQAVRTNIRRARERGFRCLHATVPDWTPDEPPRHPGKRRLTEAAATEHWWVSDRDGIRVGEAWLTVDEECALLHSLVSSERSVRWLLHTAIVERLCASSCRLLLTNSHDAPLLSPGQRHFQHLLGYSIARLRPRLPTRAVAAVRERRLAVIAAMALVAIISSQMLPGPFHVEIDRTLGGLTALLVAIKLAARRTGVATFIGGLGGLALVSL